MSYGMTILVALVIVVLPLPILYYIRWRRLVRATREAHDKLRYQISMALIDEEVRRRREGK